MKTTVTERLNGLGSPPGIESFGLKHVTEQASLGSMACPAHRGLKVVHHHVVDTVHQGSMACPAHQGLGKEYKREEDTPLF